MNRKFYSSILFTTILAVSALLIGRSALRSTPLRGAHPHTSVPHTPPSPSSFASSLANFPLAFEPNRGQAHFPAAYVARGTNFNLYLSSSEALLDLPHVARDPHNPTKRILTRSDVHIRLAGANPAARLSTDEPLPEKVNYFDRTDSNGHPITQLPTYAKIQYTGVYPGIDLTYRGTRRQLEYDFVVAPGADPNLIRMNLAGAAVKTLRIDPRGNLLIDTSVGLLTEHPPLIYQLDAAQKRVLIPGGFRLTGRNEIYFALSSYDHRKPLVIDPTLVYQEVGFVSAGIPQNEDVFSTALAVAVDSSGNAYVTGVNSGGIPEMSGGAYGCNELQTNLNVCSDIFVVKINPAGNAIPYSTSLGTGEGFGIAIDSAGDAYVAGGGWVLQGTSNAFQPAPGAGQCPNPGYGSPINCSNAVVGVLDPSGNPIYVTNLGGGSDNLNDQADAIAIDSANKIYVTGGAFGPNFPTTAGAFETSFDSNKGLASAIFIAKIDSTLSGTASLVYSTFLGGGGQGEETGPVNNPGDQGNAIAVDSTGEAYVAGITFSSSLATSGAFQSTRPEPISPFVAKLNATGSSLLWATYLGGTSGNPCWNDNASGIAIDAAGNSYVAATASTVGFPTTAGSFQPTLATFSAPFVAKLNPGGSALVYSTFVGGHTEINRTQNDLTCPDQGSNAIALDSSDDAYITGFTQTGDFPAAPLSLEPIADNNQALVAELNPAGSSLLFSTYLAGSSANGIAVDSSGGVYISGAIDFSASAQKIGLAASGPAVQLNPQAVSFPGPGTAPVTLQNLGNGALNISSIAASGDVTETDNCSPAVSAASSCTINITNTGGLGSLMITDNAIDSPQVITVYEAGTSPRAEVSRSLLSFPQENVSTTSPAQVLFLASTGNAPLVISKISASGDFAETNNCPAMIDVGTSCQISVTFTPTAAGTRKGTLEIDDNTSQAAKVSLVGGPPNLEIRIGSYNTMATITPGQTATYQLNIFDGSGYVGPATVTCTGAPKGATCTSTSPITLEGITTVNDTVKVTTTGGSSLVVPGPGYQPPAALAFGNLNRWLPSTSPSAAVFVAQTRYLVAALLFVLVFSLLMLFTSRTRRCPLILYLAILSVGAILSACGGHTTTVIVEPPPTSNATPPGTYQLIVTVTAAGSSNDTGLTLQVN